METFPPVFINREELVSQNVKLEREIGQLRKKIQYDGSLMKRE